jgi:hypothetical protein
MPPGANSTKSQKGSPTDHVGDEEKKCPPTPAMATINKKKERKKTCFLFFCFNLGIRRALVLDKTFGLFLSGDKSVSLFSATLFSYILFSLYHVNHGLF